MTLSLVPQWILGTLDGLVALSAGEVMEDYPKNYPQSLLQRSALTVKHFTLGENEQVSDDEIGSSIPPIRMESSGGGKTTVHDPIAQATLLMHLMMYGAGQDILKLDFHNLVHAQELVMLVAHLDAFLIDSLRAICYRDPRILRKSKTLSWDEIIDCGDWDRLMEKMVERYCYEFGWKSIQERVQFLRKTHGLSIRTSPTDLSELDAAEKLRHIVVHNNGRASEEYLAKQGRSNAKLGDTISITATYTGHVLTTASRLAGDVFDEIVTKFFQGDPEELRNVEVVRALVEQHMKR